MKFFRDRFDAGRILAGELSECGGRNDVIVLALPRGGVPVGFEVAKEFKAPLDVFPFGSSAFPDRKSLRWAP